MLVCLTRCHAQPAECAQSATLQISIHIVKITGIWLRVFCVVIGKKLFLNICGFNYILDLQHVQRFSLRFCEYFFPGCEAEIWCVAKLFLDPWGKLIPTFTKKWLEFSVCLFIPKHVHTVRMQDVDHSKIIILFCTNGFSPIESQWECSRNWISHVMWLVQPTCSLWSRWIQRAWSSIISNHVLVQRFFSDSYNT